jgi:hypothetical protein
MSTRAVPSRQSTRTLSATGPAGRSTTGTTARSAAAGRTAAHPAVDHPAVDHPAVDPALDEALERISDLAARLWAVRSAHRPVTVGWRRTATRCAECGQAVPCATLQAAG